QAVSLAGNFSWYWAPAAWGTTVPFPSSADALFLGSYAISIAGLVLIVRNRSRGQGWAPIIDALIITVGLAGLSWVFLMEPNLTANGVSAITKSVATAYPVTDLVIFALVIRLAASAWKTSAVWLIVGWGVSQLL